jgi:hypothetical protein
MFDDFSSCVKADFTRARFKAFLNRLHSLLRREPTSLLSFDEVNGHLGIGRSIYRGGKSPEE